MHQLSQGFKKIEKQLTMMQDTMKEETGEIGAE